MNPTFMYCRSCGWMNDKEGIGVPQCPRCQSQSAFVIGTYAELAEFRAAIAADPEAYRRFPSSDYWDK